jgi:hypothetical protein
MAAGLELDAAVASDTGVADRMARSIFHRY